MGVGAVEVCGEVLQPLDARGFGVAVVLSVRGLGLAVGTVMVSIY